MRNMYDKQKLKISNIQKGPPKWKEKDQQSFRKRINRVNQKELIGNTHKGKMQIAHGNRKRCSILLINNIINNKSVDIKTRRYQFHPSGSNKFKGSWILSAGRGEGTQIPTCFWWSYESPQLFGEVNPKQSTFRTLIYISK